MRGQMLHVAEAKRKTIIKTSMQAVMGSAESTSAADGDGTQSAAPYLVINKNGLPGGKTMAARKFERHRDAHNERAERQDEIERRLVGQLGDRYKDARLIEVSEGSYLIKNMIKLAIFGSKVVPLKRSEDSITNKKYLRELTKGDVSRKYVLEKNNHNKAAGMSTSKVQIGESVGRLLT